MKLSEESLENLSVCSKLQSPEMSTVTTIKMSRNNRKYNKITHELRLRFLDKIFFENKSIKRAAQDLNINYSSAKTILNLHRKKQRFQFSNASGASPAGTIAAPISIAMIGNPDSSINKQFGTESDSNPAVATTPFNGSTLSMRMCAITSSSAFKQQNLDLITTLGGKYTTVNRVEPKVSKATAPVAVVTTTTPTIAAVSTGNNQMILPVNPQTAQPVLNNIASIPQILSNVEMGGMFDSQRILSQIQLQQQQQQQQQQSLLSSELINLIIMQQQQQQQLEFQQKQQQNLLISQILQQCGAIQP